MDELALKILSDYPWFGAIVMFMGMARVICKPLFSLIDTVVKTTPSKKDDSKWAEIKTSKYMRFFLYLMDYLASVKIPAKSQSKS